MIGRIHGIILTVLTFYFATPVLSYGGVYLESTKRRRAEAEAIKDFDAYALQEYGLLAYGSGWLIDGVDDHARSLLRELRQLGPEFEQLIVDPGVLQYLVEFKKFVQDHQNLKAWDARDKFAQQKEIQTTVYRGMNLADVEVADVLKHGIKSSIRRKHLSKPDLSQPRFLRQIQAHLQNMGSIDDEDTDLISVSSYPHVAVGATKMYAKRNDSRVVHLFKISISKVDLIVPPFGRSISLWKFYGSGADGVILHEKDHPDVLVPLDENVERMAYGDIQPIQVNEIPVPEYGFSFFVDKEKRQKNHENKQRHNCELALKTKEEK